MTPDEEGTPERAPNCLKCEHFFVTWEPSHPRACKVFGIKSRRLPSLLVKETTGHHCPAFSRSAKIARREEGGRSSR